MEPKFQTSFIPKKPLAVAGSAPARHSVSIFLVLSVLVFIAAVGGTVFVVAWQKVLLNGQEADKTSLAADQNQFNTSLIDTLKTANTKITLAEGLLSNHLDVSEIFDIIGRLTIQSVQWKSFNFSVPAASAGGSGLATISMQGQTDSYYSVAYQSDVLGKSSQFGTNKVIKNPVLSNLSLDPSTGRVNFSFTAQIDPSELSYESTLNGGATASSTP